MKTQKPQKLINVDSNTFTRLDNMKNELSTKSMKMTHNKLFIKLFSSVGSSIDKELLEKNCTFKKSTKKTVHKMISLRVGSWNALNEFVVQLSDTDNQLTVKSTVTLLIDNYNKVNETEY